MTRACKSLQDTIQSYTLYNKVLILSRANANKCVAYAYRIIALCTHWTLAMQNTTSLALERLDEMRHGTGRPKLTGFDHMKYYFMVSVYYVEALMVVTNQLTAS
jgi:hypothetical protein